MSNMTQINNSASGELFSNQVKLFALEEINFMLMRARSSNSPKKTFRTSKPT